MVLGMTGWFLDQGRQHGFVGWRRHDGSRDDRMVPRSETETIMVRDDGMVLWSETTEWFLGQRRQDGS
jgi:hypothetical protein